MLSGAEHEQSFTQPVYCVGPSSARQRFAGGPMVVRFQMFPEYNFETSLLRYKYYNQYLNSLPMIILYKKNRKRWQDCAYLLQV